MFTQPDWVPPRYVEGVTEEGTTFVWCRGGAVRVFVNGEEIPRVITVSFMADDKNEQVASVQHVLPNGSVYAFVLERPYSSAYEAGRPDA